MGERVCCPESVLLLCCLAHTLCCPPHLPRPCRSLRHPNVVQIMGVCTDPPCLVTEFCAKGSLTDCLRAARADAGAAAQLTWRRRLTMAIDAARGLLYLHSRTIVHRWVSREAVLQTAQAAWPRWVICMCG